MSTLAERVSEAITDSGVDVAEVAKSCDISVQAVYKWMNGLSSTISGKNLTELAFLTGYEARWIISGKGLKKRGQKETIVLKAMEQMPEYKKDVLVATSNTLAKSDDDKHNGTK